MADLEKQLLAFQNNTDVNLKVVMQRTAPVVAADRAAAISVASGQRALINVEYLDRIIVEPV